ncbi:MAG TPA: hypothetical protein VHV77_12150 [Pirellulales bacterium]|jgi:hypothetical protein|nr:hypothetical protein [Pirellulales bacterium]
MARFRSTEGEAFGSDSFLDIVANMVGILIILVMIAGLRAKQIPEAGAQPSDAQQAELAALQQEEDNLTSDTQRLAIDVQQVSLIRESRKRERDSLLYLEAEAKRLLDEKRNTLSSRQQEEYDLRLALSQRETELERLTRELQDAAAAPAANAVKIENYPTPISRTVHGHEAHFQLKHNRITPVPIDEAMKEIVRDSRRTMNKLQNSDEVVETLGPFGDFRVRYTLAKISISSHQAMVDMSFVMLPMSELSGETYEQAMELRSEFRAALAQTNPRNTTMTLWTYPDSFALYRTLKRELYKQGFAVAGRPIPMNHPIGGAQDGTKSAAE